MLTLDLYLAGRGSVGPLANALRSLTPAPAVRLDGGRAAVTYSAETFASLAALRAEWTRAARAVVKLARPLGFVFQEAVVTAEDGERVPVQLPGVKPPLVLPPLDWTAFAHLIGRGPQIRLLYDALAAAFRTDFADRPHVLLYGPAGCGKTELVAAVARWLGKGAVWHLDATTLTKAGLESELLQRAQSDTLSPVLVLEEIEKAPPGVLRCLLQVMDKRAAVQRTNARTGDAQADTRCLVLATCNDLAKLGKLYAGALASRFAFKMLCPRPGRDSLRAILLHAVAERGGNPAWVDTITGFLDELDALPVGRTVDTSDPRFALSLLAGGDRLLDGSFQRDYLAACGVEG